MNRIPYWVTGISSILLLCSCRHPEVGSAGARMPAADWEQAVHQASRAIEPSLVQVTLQRERRGGSTRVISGVQVRSGGTGPQRFTGVLLTEEGHILIAGELSPDVEERIEAVVNDTEYAARPIKVDKQLKMTILKIEPEGDLQPISLDHSADLATGAWALIPEPTGEDNDYEIFQNLSFCRGLLAGRYRIFVLDRVPRGAEGAPVVDLQGNLVGFATRSGALSARDLQADLKDFLAEASGEISPEEMDKQQGWMGAVFSPVNKQYAKARDLPSGSLWVTFASEEGPAYAAGLRAGDLITALRGTPIPFQGQRAMDYFLQSLRPRIGEPFSIEIARDDQRQTLEGTFAKKPEPTTLHAEDIGITVSDVTEADRFIHNLFTDQGIQVTQIHRGGPAATSSQFGQSLLQPRDVIVELAGHPTPTVEAFAKTLEILRREKAKAALVRYWRGRTTGYAGLNLTLGDKDNGGAS